VCILERRNLLVGVLLVVIVSLVVVVSLQGQLVEESPAEIPVELPAETPVEPPADIDLDGETPEEIDVNVGISDWNEDVQHEAASDKVYGDEIWRDTEYRKIEIDPYARRRIEVEIPLGMVLNGDLYVYLKYKFTNYPENYMQPIIIFGESTRPGNYYPLGSDKIIEVFHISNRTVTGIFNLDTITFQINYMGPPESQNEVTGYFEIAGILITEKYHDPSESLFTEIII
jgi:hypothetical protein